MSNPQKILFGLLLITSVAWTIHGFFFSEAWTKRQELQEDIASVEEDNQRIEEKIAETQQRIEAIDQQPEAQKALVRDELGYIGKDEVVVELPNSNASDGAIE